MNPEAMKPFGIALQDYYRGDHEATIIQHDDYGQMVSHRVEEFYREPRKYDIESIALDLCSGRVLDAGCGSGIHSLYLQQNDFDVCAIDVSPEAVSVARDRGVGDVRNADILTFGDGLFDTILMMGHGIGMVGTLDILDSFLQHARKIVVEGGQILLTSSDFRDNKAPQYLEFQRMVAATGRYIGEIHMSIEYKDIRGPMFNWLQVDTENLSYYAKKNGWKANIIKHRPDSHYLAQLIRG